MAKVLVTGFVPGVFLGFTMMPWWWLAAVAAGLACGIALWRRSPASNGKKWFVAAIGSLALALGFFVVAVRAAEDACSRPPPDGFCFFSGLPYLALSALCLVIGFLAVIHTVRLSAHQAKSG